MTSGHKTHDTGHSATRLASVLLLIVRLCHAHQMTHEPMQQWARSAVTLNGVMHFMIHPGFFITK